MSINFHISTKNTDLTPELTNYIHEKLGVIEKFIHPSSSDQEILAEVEIGLRSRHHRKGDVYRAEINLTVDGKRYRAVTKENDMYSAIDRLKDETSRVVRKGENRSETLFLKGARKIKNMLKRG